MPGLLHGFFPSGFPTKTFYGFLFAPMYAICYTHLILWSLISPIICGKEYQKWISLCRWLWSSLTSSFFSQNILLSTLFSSTLSKDDITLIKYLLRMKLLVLTSCCTATHGETPLMADCMEGLAISGNVPPPHSSLQGGYLATVAGDELLICSQVPWDAALPAWSCVVTMHQ
jgi:hypothetical protein